MKLKLGVEHMDRILQPYVLPTEIVDRICELRHQALFVGVREELRRRCSDVEQIFAEGCAGDYTVQTIDRKGDRYVRVIFPEQRRALWALTQSTCITHKHLFETDWPLQGRLDFSVYRIYYNGAAAHRFTREPTTFRQMDHTTFDDQMLCEYQLLIEHVFRMWFPWARDACCIREFAAHFREPFSDGHAIFGKMGL